MICRGGVIEFLPLSFEVWLTALPMYITIYLIAHTHLYQFIFFQNNNYRYYFKVAILLFELFAKKKYLKV